MLNEDQATKIANAYLSEQSAQMGVQLVLAGPPDLVSKGFLFGYNTKEFFETGDINHALAGNLPFLVNYITGEIEERE
jgi:hypothetical protein